MKPLRHLIERLKERRARQATIRELRQLPPRLLRDIGIEPHQIEEIVDGLLKVKRQQAEPSAHVSRARGRHEPGKPGIAAYGGALPVRPVERCC